MFRGVKLIVPNESTSCNCPPKQGNPTCRSCCSRDGALGMMQPRCGTGGDKSSRVYFRRPFSRHDNNLYPQSVCRSTSLISAVSLGHPALVLTHALHIQQCPCSLSVFLFLCPRHHSGQLTSSHSPTAVKYHGSEGQRSCRSCFSFFTCLIYIIPPLCASIFFLPTDLLQLSNRTGSSALMITAKVWEDF